MDPFVIAAVRVPFTTKSHVGVIKFHGNTQLHFTAGYLLNTLEMINRKETAREVRNARKRAHRVAQTAEEKRDNK